MNSKKFQPDVLFEDNHLIAINKPAGYLVQGDKTGDAPLSDLLKIYLKEKYDKPGNVFCGVIHRIDRPVSGVLLFAKTSKALERMNKQFAERKAQKTYWAVVESHPPLKEDELTHFLLKNQQKNKSTAFKRPNGKAKESRLHYKWRGASDRYHLLEVNPHTGRHHQIRVQLSAIGSIIKGDLKYGAKRSNRDASIHLHALRLSFVHPVTKKQIDITAPPPPNDSVWKYFAKLI